MFNHSGPINKNSSDASDSQWLVENTNKENFEDAKKQIRMYYGVLKLYTLDEIENRNK